MKCHRSLSPACWLLLGAAQFLPVPALAQAPAAPAPAAPAAPAPAAAPAAPEPTVEPSGAVPPAPIPAPAPPAPEAAPAEAPEQPDSLKISEAGSWKPGATLQFWLFVSHEDEETESTLRLRRAELKVTGELLPKLLAYKVMIDPARALELNRVEVAVEGQEPAPATPGVVAIQQPTGNTAILQDVEITYLSEYVDVTMGQFKVPLSWEGYNSSSKLLFPERALVSRQYGDRRDLGVMASKKLGMIYYALGVFNGPGQNRLDTNNQKDIAARVEVLPIKPLMVGVAGYASVGARDEATTKDRIELDARLDVAGALVQAEYLRGWEGSTDDSPRVKGHGFYVAGGYTFFERLQPIARVGMLDLNLDADDDHVFHYELGANYYLSGHGAKVQLSGSVFDPATGPSELQIIAATQLAF